MILEYLALRASPPSEIVGTMVTAILFAVPTIGVLLNTPLVEVLGQVGAKLKKLLAGCFTHCKPPPLPPILSKGRNGGKRKRLDKNSSSTTV